jgi:hypothetical protein
MEAVISGRCGLAVLLDREGVSSFDVDDPNSLVPRGLHELPRLFAEAVDLVFLANVTIEQAREVLESEYSASLALDLVLIFLDPEGSDGVRTEVTLELEELLRDPEVTRRLENVLYGAPLPQEADPAGALRLARDAGATRTREMLVRLDRQQDVIREVKQAWDAVPVDILGSHEARNEFRNALVRVGLFRDTAIVYGSTHRFEDVSAAVMGDVRLRRLAKGKQEQALQQFVEILGGSLVDHSRAADAIWGPVPRESRRNIDLNANALSPWREMLITLSQMGGRGIPTGDTGFWGKDRLIAALFILLFAVFGLVVYLGRSEIAKHSSEVVHTLKNL